MAELKTVVIVGANLAGGRAAEALRQEGFDGRVILVGEEPHRPYERPPLSKEFLRGETPEEKLFLQPEEFYREQSIELRLGVRARRLDAAAREVELESGERLSFDHLLIATGASVRRLAVPGADLEGILYLRSIRDVERIRAEMARGRRAVVVGAGFIGAEVAASLRQKELEVAMLEVAPVPLLRALGEEMGRVYAEFHREQGVELWTGEGVQAFRGTGRVEEVVTTSGRALPCDFAVVGVGVVPATGWLEGSGVALDDGVVVDEYAETSVAGIYAAGDVARFPHHGERLRVEHFDNAQYQAQAAAKNMLGRRAAYRPSLFFWSDQYDLKLQYVGHASRWERVVLRGQPKARSFIAFYLGEGRIRAALGVNRFKDVNFARKLIDARAPVDPEKLSDPAVDLRTLVPKA